MALPEVGFRVLGGPLGVDRARLAQYRRFLLRGHFDVYEPRPHTVYQHRRKGASFNSLGFSDREWPLERQPGVTRVLCMGGSTTEGGNLDGRRGSYPFLLEQVLEERSGKEYEVMNAGMSGWTSAEMLASWFLCLQDYAPDVLVLHEGVNDLEPRFRADFRPDYSHWRRPYPDTRVHGLQRLLAYTSELYLYTRLRSAKVPDIVGLTSTPLVHYEPAMEAGRLPPETARPFVRNLESIAHDARSRGVRVVLMTMPHGPEQERMVEPFWSYGIRENNALVRELAQREELELVDAAAHFAERSGELAPEFLDLVHVSPAANRVKAGLVADVLLSAPER